MASPSTDPDAGSHQLIVVGAGGGVADIADLVERSRAAGARIEIRGLLDDGRTVGDTAYGHPVLGPLTSWVDHPRAVFVHTIRNATSHDRIGEVIERLGIPAARWATLVDPMATVASSVELGPGSFVCPGAVVAPGVRIGAQVSIGPNVTVGHDTVIGDWSILAPACVVGGRATIEPAVYVGSGASVMPEVTLGRGSLVGMGAVVVRDVRPGDVVVGNPATTLRERR